MRARVVARDGLFQVKQGGLEIPSPDQQVAEGRMAFDDERGITLALGATQKLVGPLVSHSVLGPRLMKSAEPIERGKDVMGQRAAGVDVPRADVSNARADVLHFLGRVSLRGDQRRTQ